MELLHRDICSARAAGIGEAPITTPPAAACPASVATLVLTDGLADGTITATWTANGSASADDFWEVSVGKPYQGGGRLEGNGSFKRFGTVIGTTLTLDVTGIPVGFNVFIRVRYVDQYGQASVWMQDQRTAPDVA